MTIDSRLTAEIERAERCFLRNRNKQKRNLREEQEDQEEEGEEEEEDETTDSKLEVDHE